MKHHLRFIVQGALVAATLFAATNASGQNPAQLHPSRMQGTFRQPSTKSFLLNDDVNKPLSGSDLRHVITGLRHKGQAAVAANAPRPRRIVADGTQLQGNVISSQALPAGVYGFQAARPISFDAITTGVSRANGGGAVVGNTMYVVNYTYYASWNLLWGSLYAYDTNTWKQIGSSKSVGSSNASLIAIDTDVDPTTGLVYGCTYANGLAGLQISQIDYQNASSTVVAATDSMYVGMAFDASGQLYGISSNGYLSKVDKTNGQATVIGYTGVKPGSSIQSADIDLNSGKMYWAAVDTLSATHLYEVNLSTAKATLISDMPGNEQVSMLTVPASNTSADAPSVAEDMTVSFSGASLSGNVSFKIPTVTFLDHPLSGNVNYTIYDGSNVVKTGTAAAGAQVSEQINVEGGMTTVTVVLSNAAGESKPVKRTLWTGYDQPEAPTVSLKALGAVATVSWTRVKNSVHGGTFNAADVTYDVMRLPDSVVVATGLTDSSYVDIVPSENGLKVYRYAVTAVNHGVRGAAGVSGGKVVGNAIEIPYYEKFESQDNFNIFTVIDGNGDDRKWSWYDNSLSTRQPYTAAKSPDSWQENANDYLVSAPVHLKAGKFYKLTLTGRCNAGYNNLESMEVLIGQGNAPTSASEMSSYSTLMPRFDFPYNTQDFPWITFDKLFSVKADGNYRIAFHDVSDHQGDQIELRDFSIEDGPDALAPDSVTSLTAKAGAQGALTATVTFNAPAVSLDGTALQTLDSIVVYRGDSLVSKISNAAAGRQYSVVDQHAAHGTNTYRVVAGNSHGVGLESTVSTFVGEDQPSAPTDVVLRADGDKPVLTWNAPTTGVNGGYVNPATLTYNVYTSDADGYAVDYKKGLTSTTFTADSTFDKQQLLVYGVAAQNSVAEGSLASSNTVVVGPVETLPYHESFAGGKLSTFWYMSENNSDMGLGTGYQDDDGGDILWQGQADDAYGYANTGKISLAGAETPHLIFYYWANRLSPVTLDVVAVKPDNSEVSLKTINMQKLRLGGSWWMEDVDLTSLKSEKYVQLSFRFRGHDADNATGIDNVSIYDLKNKDLSVSLQTPDEVKAGKKTGYVVTVLNQGTQNVAAGDYKVSLSIGGKSVGEQEGIALNAHQQTTFTFSSVAQANLAGKTTDVIATVTYSADENTDNNTATVNDVEVKEAPLPSVGSVKVNSGNANTVTWTKPETKSATVTDDVEDYLAWQTNNFGDWTTVEGDGATHYAISGVTLLHNSPTTAFEVFSFKESGADSTMTFLIPHSGDKAFIAMGGAKGYYPRANMQHDNDWLISPELSGDAQTLKFYLYSLESDGLDYEVLYSATTADTVNFQVLDSHVADTTAYSKWVEQSVSLPVGAKYFAIHKTGADQFGMLLDDFTFIPAYGNITGYNIYCDGELIGTVNGSETLSYIDSNDRGSGEHVYGVSALYDLGESKIVYDKDITNGLSQIAITNNTPKDIYTIDGRIVRRNATSLRGLRPGLYVIGGSKILVK